LTNVFEVVDTGKENFSGSKFLKFRPASLVPFDIRLIELALLTAQERMWLNEYNANIREVVGDELKKQNKMDTFYWMMNQTEYIPQYLSEKEYLKSASSRHQVNILFTFLIVGLLFAVNSLNL
jgi:C-terminal region of peptidase_M24